ncbi:MAG: PIN domain-containing protein [Nitrososphaerales archaeon]
MPKVQHPTIYDTRFFVEHFYSKDQDILTLTKAEIESTLEKIVSVITLHEFYRLDLEKSGREVARLRCTLIKDAFEAVGVNEEIAIQAAELRKLYRVPMGDGLIAATAYVMKGFCVTDDPHIRRMKEINSRWLS